MERAAELQIIDEVDWDFFATLTFKGTPSGAVRTRAYYSWLRAVARGFQRPFRRLLWVLREEDGAINGKEHAHALLAGFHPKQVTTGGAFYAAEMWNDVTAEGRSDTYQVVWNEGGHQVRDDGRYTEKVDAHKRRGEILKVHPGAKVVRNLKGGMSRIYVYDRGLRASAYICKQTGFEEQRTAQQAYETAKFGSEFVDQLTLANALLMHAARRGRKGKGSGRKSQGVVETCGRGLVTPRRSTRGDVGAPDCVSQFSRRVASPISEEG